MVLLEMVVTIVYSAVEWWLRSCPSHDEVFNWYGVSNMSSLTFCICLGNEFGKYDYAAHYIYNSSIFKLFGGSLVVVKVCIL